MFLCGEAMISIFEKWLCEANDSFYEKDEHHVKQNKRIIALIHLIEIKDKKMNELVRKIKDSRGPEDLYEIMETANDAIKFTTNFRGRLSSGSSPHKPMTSAHTKADVIFHTPLK